MMAGAVAIGNDRKIQNRIPSQFLFESRYLGQCSPLPTFYSTLPQCRLSNVRYSLKKLGFSERVFLWVRTRLGSEQQKRKRSLKRAEGTGDQAVDAAVQQIRYMVGRFLDGLLDEHIHVNEIHTFNYYFGRLLDGAVWLHCGYMATLNKLDQE